LAPVELLSKLTELTLPLRAEAAESDLLHPVCDSSQQQFAAEVRRRLRFVENAPLLPKLAEAELGPAISAETLALLAGCRLNLGSVLISLGRPADAVPILKKAVDSSRLLLRVVPKEPTHRNKLGKSLHNLAGSLHATGDKTGADSAIREAIVLPRQTAGVVRWRLEAGMKRREFLGILVGVGAGPLAARAQQPATMPTIGFMGAGTQSGWSRWTAAFVQRMAELGWVEGRTVAIDYRWADGSGGRYAEIAAEFAQLKVSAIVTVGGEAAKQATSSIPIIAALSGDPVAQGLAASMARPGGNFTGMSLQSTDLAGKRLELLREVVPGLRGLAIMVNVQD